MNVMGLGENLLSFIYFLCEADNDSSKTYIPSVAWLKLLLPVCIIGIIYFNHTDIFMIIAKYIFYHSTIQIYFFEYCDV